MQWQTISDRIKWILPVVLKDVFGPYVLFVMLHMNKKSKKTGSAVFLKQQGKLHRNPFMRDRNGKWWKLDTSSSAPTSVRREESSTNPHTIGKQLHCSEASWTALACEDLALGPSPTEQHTLSLIPRESHQEKRRKGIKTTTDMERKHPAGPGRGEESRTGGGQVSGLVKHGSVS